MRTIKFRWQKISNGVWVYGSLVSSDALNTAIYFQVGNGSIKQMEWVYVNPDTVGQFTGLLDKNGKEIYEGDVVRHIDRNYSVDFYNGAFCLVDDLGVIHEDVANVMRSSTIIGNIHDNPDLTKFVMRCDQ